MASTRWTYLWSCLILAAIASSASEQKELQADAGKLGSGGPANRLPSTTAQPLQQPVPVIKVSQPSVVKPVAPRAAVDLCRVWRMNSSFDEPSVLSEIYGDRFDPKVVGTGRILVLGQHNSGTSITTRLVMLLGAYQGSMKYIVISKNNKLKFFENTICARLNELVLDAIGDPHYWGYHAQGLDFNRLKSSLRTKFKCQAVEILKHLNRHPPWVLKDPRMIQLMPLWRNVIGSPDLVCVIVYKDAVRNSLELAKDPQKSRTDPTGRYVMTPQHWLDAWSTGMLETLKECKGLPTIVIDSSTIVPDVPGALKLLLSTLKAAGVTGLVMPSAAEIQDKVLKHLWTPNQVENKAVDVLDASNMPVLSPIQKALGSALLFWAKEVANKPWLDLRTVAEQVLKTVKKLTDVSTPTVQPQLNTTSVQNATHIPVYLDE